MRSLKNSQKKSVGIVGIMLFVWWFTTAVLWLMAFGELDGAPDWLARAQSVCFGTLPNGLPDTYGWLALTVGPLSLLAGLLVVYIDDITHLVRAVGTDRLIFGAVALVVFGSLAEMIWVANRLEAVWESTALVMTLPVANEQLDENYPQLNRRAGDFELIDQHGKILNLEGLRGVPVFLTFAFAHCQTICPTIVKRVQEAMDATDGFESQLLIVTLDPWRDTPGALPGIAKGWGLRDNERVLSGEIDEVLRVLDVYGVPRDRDETNGQITHPALVFVISSEGRLMYGFNNPHPSWLRETLERMESTGQVAAGR